MYLKRPIKQKNKLRTNAKVIGKKNMVKKGIKVNINKKMKLEMMETKQKVKQKETIKV